MKSITLDHEKYQLYQADLEAAVAYQTEGTMFHSTSRWYEKGEKNSKYVYSLEKLNYNNKTLRSLILSDRPNSITQDQKKILLEQINFIKDYTHLMETLASHT